jgi:hypothetical protein
VSTNLSRRNFYKTLDLFGNASYPDVRTARLDLFGNVPYFELISSNKLKKLITTCLLVSFKICALFYRFLRINLSSKNLTFIKKTLYLLPYSVRKRLIIIISIIKECL